jgi:autotransporter-associated beta strand protein
MSAGAGDFWWRGDINNNWSATTTLGNIILNTNFATASDGLIEKFALPGSGDIVRFASSNGAFFNTSLGSNFSISGLTTEPSLTSNVNISNNTLNFDFNSIGIVTNAPRNLTINSTITLNTTALEVNTAHVDSSVNIASSLTGVHGLSKSGPGTLNLNSANTYQLFTVVKGGVLVTTEANALPSNKPLTIGDGDAPAAGRVRTLGNAQSVSTLNMFARSSASQTALDISSGTFTVTGNISVLDNVTSQGNAFATVIDALPGGTLSLGGGVRNVTIAGQNVFQGELRVAPVITNGGINLTANPSSTVGTPAGMVLSASAPNTYTGGTTVNAGFLEVNASTTLGPGALTLKTTGGVDSRVILNNATQTLTSLSTGAVGTAIPALTLNSTALTVNESGIQNFAGTIGGSGSLTKSGTGTLTLARANTYAGGSTILAGTLAAGAANALPTGRPLTIGRVSESATGRFETSGFAQSISSLTLFARSGFTQTAIDVGSGTLTLNGDVSLLDTQDSPGNAFGAIIAAAPGGTLNLGGATRTFTLAGQNVSQQELVVKAVVSNGSIILNANPSSTVLNPAGMVLDASAPNTYGGGTTVNSGFLSVNAQTTLGNGPLTLNTTGSVESRVILNNAVQNITVLNTSSIGSVLPQLTLNSTALTVNPVSNSTFGGVINGTGSLTKSGVGVLTLTGSNTYSGGTTITASTLQLGNGGTSGAVTGNITNNAALIFNRSNDYLFAGNISGNGTIEKKGAGKTTLTGSLSFSSATVTQGTLQIGNNTNLPQIVSPIVNNASLIFNVSNNYGIFAPISGSGSVTYRGSGTLHIMLAASTYTGGTTIDGTTLQIDQGGTSGSIVGNVSLVNNGILTFFRSDSFSFPGSITGNGVLAVFTPASPSFTGNINTTSNFQAFSGGTINFQAPVTLGTVEIYGAQTTVRLGEGGANTLTTGVIFLQNLSNTIETTDNDIILNYSGASPIADIISNFQSGQLIPNGDLNGLPTTLAIAEAADLGLDTFNTIPIDETTVLLKYTYVGDANLDGQVDALDYERIDLAIGNSGVFGTAQGDLNYDGNVDALDYEQVDLNIGNGVGQPLGLGGAPAAVFIPEPSAVAVLAVLPLLAARRRLGGAGANGALSTGA